MSHRPNESFDPMQQRKYYWYNVGGKMGDKNLEQRINISFV
jgi:hypothetical protein